MTIKAVARFSSYNFLHSQHKKLAGQVLLYGYTLILPLAPATPTVPLHVLVSNAALLRPPQTHLDNPVL